MQNKSELLPILQKLLQKRYFLAISPENSTETYNSRILKIEDNQLEIDQLFPAGNSPKFQPGQKLTIKFIQNKHSYQLSSQFLSSKVGNRGKTLVISFPCELLTTDKRNDFRIDIKIMERPKTIIKTLEKETLHGKLQNISAGGALIRFELAGLPLVTGQQVHFAVQFKEQAPLICQAIVKHVFSSRGSQEIAVGIQFSKLISHSEKQLDKLLIELHRQSIKSDPAT